VRKISKGKDRGSFSGYCKNEFLLKIVTFCIQLQVHDDERGDVSVALSPLFKALLNLPEQELIETVGTWQVWLRSEQTRIKSLCKQFSKEAKGNDFGESVDDRNALREQLNLLDKLETSLAFVLTDEKQQQHEGEKGRNDNRTSVSIGKRTSSFKRRREALTRVATKVHEKRRKMNRKAIEFLTNFVKKAMQPVTSMPLHELFFFKDEENSDGEASAGLNGFSFKTKMLDYRMQYTMHASLAKPERYLGGHSRKVGDLDHRMDDITIAHGILMEMGQTVNLHDWYQAFAVVHGQQYPMKELQARFTQACSELQFVGIIEPSTRKIDHVQKVTNYRPQVC